MEKKKVITDPKIALSLFILCWTAYFITYLGRLNFSSAIPAMIEAGVLNKSSAGLISTLFFAFYGGGQFINGYLGDRVSPRIMISVGLFLSAIANMLMGSVTSPIVMAIIWAVNGYAQAMIWPPIVYSFAHMLDKRTMVKCSINITSTIACGTLVAYLMSAVTIKFIGYNAPFFAAAIIMAIMSVVWYIGFGRVEKAYQRDGEYIVEEENKKGDKKPVDKKISAFKLLLASGTAVVVIPVMIHGILKDGVTNWVPTLISESFNTTATVSILATLILPVINLVGAYAAHYINNKYIKDVKVTSGLFFMLSFLSIVVLAIWGKYSIVLSVCMLAITTSSMLAVNTMLINVLPLSFARYGKTATISGIFNALAYVGTALSTYVIGYMADKFGWEVAIISWAVLAIVAALLMLKKSKKKVDLEV